MLNKSVEQAISWFLYVGVTFTTVFLVTDSVTDPVNVTKLAAAGGVGFAVFAIVIFQGRNALFSSSKSLMAISVLFVLAMFNAILQSSAPFSQNIYGTYGRQTAFIFYLVMVLVALGASVLREAESFNKIIYGLFIAGILNVLYCAWVLVFGDFLSWTNPYKAILGLFGNPDFISAFLGIFISEVVAYIAAPKQKLIIRIAGILIASVAFIEIYKSKAIQGVVVTTAGLAIVGFYLIRHYFNQLVWTVLYTMVISTVGAFALAGALQHGPLAKYVYKVSVSLRGQYWLAAIETGNSRPFSGVGMDAFGDWYRRMRSDYAVNTLPGARVITNAAHNVVLDFFASGGWPLLLTYVAMLLLGIWTIIRVTARRRNYDHVFVGMATAWICYELQSIISINQAGLAIWGWVLLGALIAYEFSTRLETESKESAQNNSKRNLAKKDSVFSPQLIGGIGAVIGVLIAVPPMSADMKWKSALKSRQLPKVEAALQSGYMQPTSSMRLAQAVQMFEQSKLPDQAYTYAKKGVEFNPDYFDAWKMLYFISKSTEADKKLALENMKRLDPKNPDVLSQ